jgi:nitrous oxide reductase accessory protein NosL
MMEVKKFLLAVVILSTLSATCAQATGTPDKTVPRPMLIRSRHLTKRCSGST